MASTPDGRLSPAEGSARLAQERADVLAGLRSRVTEHRQALLTHLPAAAHGAAANGDTELEKGRQEMVDALIEIGLRAIEQGEPWEGPLPEAVRAQGRRAAAAGMSVETMFKRCMDGFAFMRRVFFDELERQQMPRRHEHALRRQASEAMDALRLRVFGALAETHSRELATQTRSMQQRRAEITDRLLAGATPPPEELALLDYEIDGWHIGLIATGKDAECSVRTLRAQLGCQALAVCRDEQTVHASLAVQPRINFEAIERVFCARCLDMDASLAVGEPGRGPHALHISHEEAQAAREVARYRPRRLTRYADVAIDAALLSNEEMASTLIARCLTPLDEGGGGAMRRRVMRELFHLEYNKTLAAEALDLNPETIRRHVKEIQDRLGHPLPELQTEIQLALRAEELRECRASGDV
ncbi:MAG: CdaR family protein [Solirubrobacteraceae bacterium]